MTTTRPSTTCVVLTVDQLDSRHQSDRVPRALERLAPLDVLLPFGRTAGDEFQGVLVSPAACTDALLLLLRDGGWHIGVGLGTVEHPLPATSREGRGSGFLAARSAVEAAGGGTRPQVRAATSVAAWLPDALETALWLWKGLLDARSVKGWEVVDLLDTGMTQQECARRLGIAQSAVTQRAGAARLVEGRRAQTLVETLLMQHLASDDPAHSPA